MKSLSRVVVTFAALISVAAGCSEPTQLEPEAVPQPRAPDVPNTAPVARVGVLVDTQVVAATSELWWPLPAASGVLVGLATDAESNIESYLWRKISGPESYLIESPHSQRTKVAKLEKGRYEFELTVTDKGQLTGKDTVRVLAYDPAAVRIAETVIYGLVWRCPMGCTVVVENLYNHVPIGAAFKVFINSDASGKGWVEAKSRDEWKHGDRYMYEIYTGKLGVYTDDEQGAVDVRIRFLAPLTEAAKPPPAPPSELRYQHIDGVYDLSAAVKMFDPAWGDLTGYRYTGTLTLTNGEGTFSDFRLLDENGGIHHMGSGSVRRSISTGRLVLELAGTAFHWTAVVASIAEPEGRSGSPGVAGNFGMGGHIAGTFVAARRSP